MSFSVFNNDVEGSPVTATGIATAGGGTVIVNGSAAPSAGAVLTASSATEASWVVPPDVKYGSLVISVGTSPTPGQVLFNTSGNVNLSSMAVGNFFYTKIGDIVTCTFYINPAITTTTPGNNTEFQFSNLPFRTSPVSNARDVVGNVTITLVSGSSNTSTTGIITGVTSGTTGSMKAQFPGVNGVGNGRFTYLAQISTPY